MAATDTIVGIAGAVLLAAVMVGVFVYEYNNAPAAAPTGDAALVDHFKEDYPALNATGDLDGDHVPNFKDNDMDGDGIDNLNDTTILYVARFTGTMPAPTPPAQASAPVEFHLHVDPGANGAVFTLYYNTTTPGPLPRAPQLDLSVTGPEGNAGSSPTASQAQQSRAVTVVINAEALAAGDYTIKVTQSIAGPSASFAVKAAVDYGAGHAAAGHQH